MAGPKPNDPYTPYDASPSGMADMPSGNDYRNVQVSPNAFGAQIGQATEKLGGVLQQQTQKFGDMYMDSIARDQGTAASKELSDLEMQFKQNKGANAATAYPEFQKNASELMDKYSDGLPLAAQMRFKDQFSRELNGALFRSGSYVGDQVEQGQLNSFKDSISNNTNQFVANIGNPTADGYLDQIRDNTAGMADHLGIKDPRSVAGLASKNLGDAIYYGIKSNVQANPDQAKALYDKYSNATYPVVGMKDGQQVTVNVPYLDAQHRAQIETEMQGEFRRQEGEQFQTARAWAASGQGFDQNALVGSMRNAGRSQDYINAQVSRLNEVRQNFGSAEARYNVGQNLQNDEALAFDGRPVQGTYDVATLTKAYPKNPEKVQEILSEAGQLHQVAGVVGEFGTKTPAEIYTDLQKFKPAAAAPDPVAWTMLHEGGFVTNDSGKGPSNFGVNKEANPDIDVSNLTADQAHQILKSRYYDKVVTPDMSPKMAQVAGDTAVNMGVSKAQTLINQSGGDPQKLIDLRRAEYQRLAQDDPEKYGQSLPGWMKRMDDMQQSVSSLPSGGQSGYAEQQRLYEKLSKATQNYMTQLSNDPAGTLTSKDPILNGLYSNATQDPNQWGKYIDAVWARQEAIGIPETSRTALPAQAASSMVDSITANPAGAPDMMNKLQQQTGQYWPRVYHSLVAAGNLPPAYQAVSTLNENPDTKKDAYLLSRWMGEDTKGKVTADLIGGTKNETEIKTNIEGNTDIGSLKQSLVASGQSKEQVEGTIDAVRNLAYANVYYNNMKPTDAAQKAADVFSKRYEFMPQGGARVPADKYEGVKFSADNMLSNIDNFAVPADIYSDRLHGTVTKPENYYAWVKAAPTWVTSPNEDALWLKDPEDRWVRGKDGNPISVGFNQQIMVNPKKPLEIDPLVTP